MLDLDRLRQTDAAPGSRAKSGGLTEARQGWAVLGPRRPLQLLVLPIQHVFAFANGVVDTSLLYFGVRRFARLDQVVCRSARCLLQVVQRAPDSICAAAGQALDLPGPA